LSHKSNLQNHADSVIFRLKVWISQDACIRFAV
jgi:hypothetical protein